MMNPSPWCNPPPPGIEMDDESKHSNASSTKSYAGGGVLPDPYIKNPEYLRYKRGGAASRRSRSRSFERHRSRSRSRERRRRHRSRSRSTRHKRSRSRSRSRRHRRHTPSCSQSRSRSASQTRSGRHHRHKHSSRKSTRRSRSRSRSYERRRAERKFYQRSAPPPEGNGSESKGEDEDVDAKEENAFKNDGSFLEMFKKMQEEKLKAEAEKVEAVAAPAAGTSEQPKRLLPAFGKRRGGRVLKTGMVEKTKAVEDDELANATDPWSIYLKEVKRYKEACCDDDSKTRPLVK